MLRKIPKKLEQTCQKSVQEVTGVGGERVLHAVDCGVS